MSLGASRPTSSRALGTRKVAVVEMGSNSWRVVGEGVALPCWSVERHGDDEAFARVFGRKLVVA